MNGINPYATSNVPPVTPAVAARSYKIVFPVIAFPLAFLASASFFVQIWSDDPRPIGYVKTLLIDVPIPFWGTTLLYLLLRNSILRATLGHSPTLAIFGGVAAFLLMSPIYFGGIAPLLSWTENEFVHTAAMLLGAAGSAVIVETLLDISWRFIYRCSGAAMQR